MPSAGTQQPKTSKPIKGDTEDKNEKKKSGFKPFSRFPSFGGRGVSKKLDSVDELRGRVFYDPDHQDLVIGATIKSPSEGAKSHWKLSQEDFRTLHVLFNKYEQLMAMYEGWSPTERVKDWDKRLHCYQAVFCQNAIYRMQGLLAKEEPNAAKGQSQPYRLPSNASAFEPGTKFIAQRIGIEPDLMWGWWINEVPTSNRPRELMQAVESVKSAVRSVYQLQELQNTSRTFAALRASFQSIAVLAVSEFARKWDPFPITIEHLVELGVVGKESDIIEEPEEESAVESPQIQTRKHGNPKGKQKEISDSVHMAGVGELVPDSAADEVTSEQQISAAIRLSSDSGDDDDDDDDDDDEKEEDQLDDDDEEMQDVGHDGGDSDESYRPSPSTSKKADTSKSKRAARKTTSGQTAQPTYKAKTAATPGKEKPIMLRIPRLKTAPAEQPKSKTGGHVTRKMQASDTGIKQALAQQRKKAPKPKDTPDGESDPLGPVTGKAHESTQPPLFLPNDEEAEYEPVNDVIRALEGNQTSEEKIDTVRTFLEVIYSIGSQEELETIKRSLSKPVLYDFIRLNQSLLEEQNEKLAEAEKLLQELA